MELFNNNKKENEITEESKMEKKNIFTKIGERVDAFNTKHPKLSKALKVGGIATAAAAGTAGVALVLSKLGVLPTNTDDTSDNTPAEENSES